MKSLWIYFNHGLVGNALVSWVGPCLVTNQEMLDGEDLLAGDKICGDKMVHFVMELFDESLVTAVCIQRLLADLVKKKISEMNPDVILLRDGDDLYFKNKKLSISIAAPSLRSVLIHFAINVTNSGTPVETASLEDFNIDPHDLASLVLNDFSKEWLSIKEASFKVRGVLSC